MSYDHFLNFIIPTKNRATLNDTLQSIDQLFLPRFMDLDCLNVVSSTVVFDNIDIPEHFGMINWSQVYATRTPEKYGVGVNGAGKVRNYGYDYFAWRGGPKLRTKSALFHGFVDDDDTVACTYAYDLYRYWICDLVKPKTVVVFKMRMPDGRLLPPGYEHNRIEDLENKVGISFACTEPVLDSVKFDPSSGEDFNFLLRAKEDGATILFSPHVNYIVAPKGTAPDRLPK